MIHSSRNAAMCSNRSAEMHEERAETRRPKTYTTYMSLYTL